MSKRHVASGLVVVAMMTALPAGAATLGLTDFGIYAAQGPVQIGNNASIAGSVGSGGALSVGNNSALSGDLHAGSTVSLGTNATVSGSVTPNAAALSDVSLPSSVTPTSPAGNSQTGGANQNLTLAPGSYQVLNYNSGFDLFLTAGDYYFSSFELGSNSRILYDLSLGGINIFVDGNVSIGNGSKWGLTDGTAADVLWQVGGDFDIGNNAELFGTIHTTGTPMTAGDIDINNNTRITGALYSAGGIRIGNNFQFDHVPHSSFGQNPNVDPVTTPMPIPLPAAGWLLLGGLGALAAMRRRKQAA